MPNRNETDVRLVRRGFGLGGASPAAIFVQRLVAVALLAGFAIRARIFSGATVPPDTPSLWFLSGTLQDLAVFSIIAFVLLSLFRCDAVRWTHWSVMTSGFLVLVALHAVWSEIVIFFGYPLRFEELNTGLHPRLLLGSAQGATRAAFVATIALFAGAALVSALGTNRRSRRAVSRRHYAVAGIGALSLLALPLPVHRSDIGRNPVVGFAIALGEKSQGAGWGTAEISPPREFEETAIRELLPSGTGYLDERYPLARLQRLPGGGGPLAGRKPNIVFLLLEGIRTEEVGAYGSQLPGITPHLDRFARLGWKFEDVFSVGGYTPEGELAIWYGLLASPYEIVIRSRPRQILHGLPEILSAHGWKSFFWIHPGDQSLYLSTDFYRHRGFMTIDGRDYPSSDPFTNWGHSDRALARRGIEALRKAEEPFAAMLLTVSNHHPYQLPSDAVSDYALKHRASESAARKQFLGHHTAAMLRTIHYTDESLGYFMSLASREPWFENTIFVIAGDHGVPVPPVTGRASFHELMELRHKVPLIIYSPLLDRRVVAGPATQADVVPTLLGLLGIETPIAGAGIDLLRSDHREERAIVSWSMEARTVTVVRGRLAYHATAIREESGWVLSDELLVDRISDPKGEVNRKGDLLSELERMRRDAAVYLEVYPWLIAENRSGVPPGARTVMKGDRLVPPSISPQPLADRLPPGGR